MRTLKFIIEKEFKQIFRNKMMLLIIFAMPVIQLIILAYAATFEIKNVDLGVLDMDKSHNSRELINKFQGSPFFHLVSYQESLDELNLLMKRGEVEQILYIPAGFEKDIDLGKPTKIQIINDAVNSSAASLMSYYSQSIIFDYNRNILINTLGDKSVGPGINTDYQYWFNQELDYKKYMVPGILVLLVTLIGSFLSGMNIVKEKEIGTIEQLNVTPIKKIHFIIGKLLPFWIIAMIDLIIGLLLARFVFGINIVGSIWLVFGVTSIYLLAVLGVGLFISTITDTQQQAMFLAWFFLVIFIMLSGLFTPIESMPDWAQKINIINPISYFIRFMRQVILKGSGFMDVINDIISISIYSVAVLSLAVFRYRKVS